MGDLTCGSLTLKYMVFIFNGLFFLSGLTLIGIGAVAQGFFRQYLNFFENEFSTPAVGIIILGFIIVIISFFGCCGAKKENICMLHTFSVLIFMIFVCEIAAAITIAALKPKVEDQVKENMVKTMDHYGEEKSLLTLTWDDLQTKYNCCGTNNYTDWSRTHYGKNVSGVPDSCCIKPTKNCGWNIINMNVMIQNKGDINTKGCYLALHDSAMRNIGAVAGGAIAIALLQIIGILMSCCLARGVRERYEIL